MKKVVMKNVVSSNVDKIGFSKERSLLFVEFIGGSVYEYKGVTEQQFDSLLTSPSIGRTIKSVSTGLDYRKIPSGELEDALSEETVEEQVSTEKGKVTEEPPVVKSNTEENYLKVLLSYYQGKGDRVDQPVKSILGNDCLIGEHVFSVLVVHDGRTIILPLKHNELGLVSVNYFIDGIRLDNEGVGVPVLFEREDKGTHILNYEGISVLMIKYQGKKYMVSYSALKYHDMKGVSHINTIVTCEDGSFQKIHDTSQTELKDYTQLVEQIKNVTVEIAWNLVKNLVTGVLSWD